MNSKKLNVIMIVCLVLFCVIFGVAAAVRAAELERLDREHEQQQEQQRQEELDNALNDASTTQKNEQTNNSGSNSSNSVETAIDFSSFSSMYTAAEKKLANATNIMSTYTGSAKLSGPTNYGGITVDNETIYFNFERYKNATEQLVKFSVTGDMLDGLFFLDYSTTLYSNSAIYNYYFNQQNPHWQTLSKAEQANKFGWNVNSTFHSATADAIKSSTAVIHDKSTKTYTATAELDCSKACTKASHFFKGVMDSSNPATYQKCKITATIKENGSFSKIRYQETFKISVYNAEYNARIDATVVADYTETFSSVNENAITIYPPTIS